MKKLNSYQGKTKAIIGKIELLFHIEVYITKGREEN